MLFFLGVNLRYVHDFIFIYELSIRCIVKCQKTVVILVLNHDTSLTDKGPVIEV